MKRITLLAFAALCLALSFAQKPYYNIEYHGRVYNVSYTSYDKSVTIYPLLEDVYKEQESIEMNVDGFKFQFRRPGDNVTDRWKEELIEYVDPIESKGTISMKLGILDKLIADYDDVIGFYTSIKEQKIKSTKDVMQMLRLIDLCSLLPKGSKEESEARELANKGKIKEPLISLASQKMAILEGEKNTLLSLKKLSKSDPKAFLLSHFPKSLCSNFDSYSNHQLDISGDVRYIKYSKKLVKFLNPYISKDSLILDNPNFEDSLAVKIVSTFGRPGYDKELINYVYYNAFVENKYNIQKENALVKRFIKSWLGMIPDTEKEVSMILQMKLESKTPSQIMKTNPGSKDIVLGLMIKKACPVDEGVLKANNINTETYIADQMVASSFIDALDKDVLPIIQTMSIEAVDEYTYIYSSKDGSLKVKRMVDKDFKKSLFEIVK